MTIPALVVAGVETKIFDLEGIKILNRMIPDARLELYESCGHWLYLEDPYKFAEDVYRFVKEREGVLLEE